MTNEQIRDFLEKHAEKQFKDFTSSPIPGTDSILGVRLPVLRSLAKQLAKEDWRTYLKEEDVMTPTRRLCCRDL